MNQGTSTGTAGRRWYQRIVLLLVGAVAGLVLYHYAILDLVIDRRAKNLGMMQYSGVGDKYEAKAEHKWMLQYLKHGYME
jgi:hypothetical protein